MVKQQKELDVNLLFTEPNLGIEEILELKNDIISSINQRRKFEKLLADFPDQKRGKLSEDQAAARQGVGYWIINQPDRAIPLLESVHSSRFVNYFLGLCYLENNRPQAAVELLKKLYQDEPDKVYFITAYANALIKMNTAEEALSILEKARKNQRAEADLFYYSGLCLDTLGEYEKAKSEYQHALRLAPDHAPTLFRQAYCADLNGSDELAISLYERLSFQRPTYINALLNLGLLYEDKNIHDKAVECYHRILEYYPNHPRARMYLKDTLASQNMHYDEEKHRREKYWHGVMGIPITDFPLSTRSRAVLDDMGVKTLGDLANKTEDQLLKCENFGATSLNELKELLARKGLTFAQPGVTSPQETPKGSILEQASITKDVLNKSIFDMEWSTRIRTCFSKLKIYTLRDLVTKSEGELLGTRNLGQISLKEVKQRLAEMGLTLRQGS